MVTFQKNELVVILNNPEFNDADDYFATVKYKEDYNFDLHAFNQKDDRNILKLNFKEVPHRYVEVLRQMVYTYNHTTVQFIDWQNAGHSAVIRNNQLDAKADAKGEYYSFSLEVEIL